MVNITGTSFALDRGNDNYSFDVLNWYAR